jgi:hypothetical protein
MGSKEAAIKKNDHMSGWIKLHRKILDNDMFNRGEFSHGQAWIYLLLIANYEDSMMHIGRNRVLVKRGEVGRSGEFLRAKFGWSRGRFSRWLTVLETNKQAVQLKRGATSLISICNYEDYQDGGTANGTVNGTANDQRTVQQTVQRTVQQKRNKENKNKEKSVFLFSELNQSEKTIQNLVVGYDSKLILADVQKWATENKVKMSKEKWVSVIKSWVEKNPNKYQVEQSPAYYKRINHEQ